MKRVFLALALMGLLCSSAFATEAIKQGRGKLSVSGSASFQRNTSEVDMLILATEVGYFVVDDLEVAVKAMGMVAEADGMDMTMMSGLLSMKYHVDTESPVVPYVGPQVALVYIDYGIGDDTEFGWGGFAGMDFFVTENVSLFVEYNLLLTEGMGQDLTQHALNFGMSLFW
jgi:opacity protein-like surface antigen